MSNRFRNPGPIGWVIPLAAVCAPSVESHGSIATSRNPRIALEHKYPDDKLEEIVLIASNARLPPAADDGSADWNWFEDTPAGKDLLRIWWYPMPDAGSGPAVRRSQ